MITEDRVFSVLEQGEYILVLCRPGEAPDVWIKEPGPYRVVRRPLQEVPPDAGIAV